MKNFSLLFLIIKKLQLNTLVRLSFSFCSIYGGLPRLHSQKLNPSANLATFACSNTTFVRTYKVLFVIYYFPCRRTNKTSLRSNMFRYTHKKRCDASLGRCLARRRRAEARESEARRSISREASLLQN